MLLLPLVALLSGCADDVEPEPVPLAEGIYAPLGEIIPTATEAQRETFERGRAVALHRFSPEEGLGPRFNVTFCAACHERPTTGGSAGHYRDFLLQARRLGDGTLIMNDFGGVSVAYGIGDEETRPALDTGVNVLAGRNPIPFFGVGLIAELSDEAILAHADPDDEDGDGISGRPNYEDGFVGRFGRKSQTRSIEGFIRGPLNNHLGITTDPLSEELLDALPVPSGREGPNVFRGPLRVAEQAQAAAPTNPLTDLDDVEDPEMSAQALFDLVSFSMLLAAPEPEPLDDSGLRGQQIFDETGCTGCHVPTLNGPRGALPLYSDLLLHDMGDELADGITQGVAGPSEFRTQPLWGVSAVGPYLHDGRADTLTEAIEMHGGEAQTARDAFVALDPRSRADVVEFLLSLGGRNQTSSGLLPANAVDIPEPGEPGAPVEPLEGEELDRFVSGRELYDRDMGVQAGLGPVFNGDSCRACHFDPVIGGSGPLGVNVMRHGTWGTAGFEPPPYGTILHKLALPDEGRVEQTAAHNVFEPRQTPPTFGLGLIESIDDDSILALADPDDADGDGIRGIAQVLPDGRLGRFGWKAQVPTVREFVRDALSAEVGLTVPSEDGLTFGLQVDNDDVDDPEMSLDAVDDLEYFLVELGALYPVAEEPEGRAVFESVGCADCHVPELPGRGGAVPLYSDLLLHDVAPEGYQGVPDGLASGRHFRTPPLWGLSRTAPYMHDGLATTVEDALLSHFGEAAASREAFEALDTSDADALIRFLESL